MHNLLTDPVFTVREESREKKLSLPEVLAALSAGQRMSFARLMPHQKHAWYAFLVQLAAMALHRVGESTLPEQPEKWQAMIRSLTEEYAADEPWQLIVEDLNKPAFMQPPVPEGSLKRLDDRLSAQSKKRFRPLSHADDDNINVLVPAKNHDLKRQRMTKAQPEHWIFALITLQTMEGYSGVKNYGISRMNSGKGSRPAVGVSPGIGWSTRFNRDLEILLKCRGDLLERYEFFKETGGLALLWLSPWDGESSISVFELDPFYIEICRRVRLREENGKVLCYYKNTEEPRIEAEDLKGNIGDPWAPIRIKDGACLTLSKETFNYDRLSEIIFGSEFKSAPCQKIHENDLEEGLQLLIFGLVRGQEPPTDGLHERWIPISKSAREMLIFDEKRDKLAEMAKERIQDVRNLERKALKPAILALLQRRKDSQEEKEKRKMDDSRPRDWLQHLNQKVDQVFFPRLWQALEPDADAEKARIEWQRELVELGREVLQQAEKALPIATAHRYRAISRAWAYYEGGACKFFPSLYEKEEKDDRGRYEFRD